MTDQQAGSITLAEATAVARTGDIWLFRGRSAADTAERSRAP